MLQPRRGRVRTGRGGRAMAAPVVAALCLTVFAVYSVRYRRAMKDPSKQAAMMRQAHVYRERRGF